jgi:hypothetical protein
MSPRRNWEGLGESQFGRLEKKLSTLPTLWDEAKLVWRLVSLENLCYYGGGGVIPVI